MPLPISQYAGVDREAIWAALFAHFKASFGSLFVTMSRKHLMPPALSQELQPAFFQLQIRERRGGETARGLPNTLTLQGFLVIYVPAPGYEEEPGQEQALAATTLNAIYKAIDDAMMPDEPSSRRFTLGGLVYSCVVDGEVEQDPGILGTQAAAILPVRILVP